MVNRTSGLLFVFKHCKFEIFLRTGSYTMSFYKRTTSFLIELVYRSALLIFVLYINSVFQVTTFAFSFVLQNGCIYDKTVKKIVSPKNPYLGHTNFDFYNLVYV